MTKYNNKKIKHNELIFDSKKEYNRYLYLKSLEDKGVIKYLETQRPYELIPTQKLSNGKVERAVKYVADFAYFDGLNQMVEDVKGMKKGQAYALFVIKRKLMLQVHGIEIIEI
jgi:hypothetical protein